MAKIRNKKDAIKALNPNNPRIQVTYRDPDGGRTSTPNSKKKRKRNTNVSTGSSSLKINRSSRARSNPLNL